MKLNLSILLCCILLTYSQRTFSQTTDLSGVVNVYATLQGQNRCTSTITIDDATAFSEGMGVIILQMDGADIDLSNNSNYGNITDRNNTGIYEYNQIAAVDGNTLTLALAQQYDYSFANTQVVGFDIHENAEVTGVVNAPSWDGSTGGVIVIETTGTLTLTGNVDASGLGFRGGEGIFIEDNDCNFLTFANDYAYDITNWRGAPKGEGIGAASTALPYGRGAQANGGGGGNDHNSGGGGGALHTAGGQGGTNEEPSTFGCDGNFPGTGGKAIPLVDTLAFLGGGGGSGHANNGTGSAGANGGGIIFIVADEVNFNGGRLLSEGASALLVNGDGGGGGGAGGTIFLLANSSSGESDISVRGGDGASVSNINQDRCFGPGGGGSGGVFWSNLPLGLNQDGGNAGLTINSTACPEGTNGAQDGEGGLAGNVFALVQGAPFAPLAILSQSNDTMVCKAQMAELVVNVPAGNFEYQWQLLVNPDTESWVDVNDQNGLITGSQTNTLNLLATEPTEGTYRLVIIDNEGCGGEVISEFIEFIVLPLPLAFPTATVNGFTVDFTANLENAFFWTWEFEPGQTSNELNPTYTFPAPGTYEVRLDVSNEQCGADFILITVTINEPLVAAINTSISLGCAPFTVAFSDASEGNITDRSWVFPGGDPATSTDQAPIVTFEEAGSYEVSLTISNSNDQSTVTEIITVVQPPVPSFSFTTNQLTVTFNNNSNNAELYTWSFGDNNTSNEENPVHTYSTPGTYEVSLSAANEACGVAFSQSVSVTITNTETINYPNLIHIFPNPARTQITITGWQAGPLLVYSNLGERIVTFTTQEPFIDIRNWPKGTYILYWPTEGVSQQLIKQ